MGKTVKVGIIGAGRIGKIHAEHLLRLDDAEVAAISDPLAGTELEAWASKRGIRRITTDTGEVIGDPAIDAVFICSPTDTHVPLTLAAAAAGKHIFCEKPVSMDLQRTQEALEAVRRAGVMMQIGFNRRFDHNFKRVRELVQEGRIGEPQIVKITSRDPSPPAADYIRRSGGLFMDMAIHDFDMARYLAGSEVEEVYAKGAVLVDPVFAECGDIDTAITTLRFKNGAIGVIDNSRRAVYGYDQRVEVFGSGGSVTADNDFPNSVVISHGEGVVREKPLYFFLERYKEAFLGEIRWFMESIRTGSPVEVDGFDALQAERIAHAAKRSARLGRPVLLSELEPAGKQHP